MKKKKGKIILCVIVLLFILWFVNYNLKSNSAYYARHMPKGRGQYPEYIMLIDNLDKMIDPNIDGVDYDIDGNNAVRKNHGEIYFSNINSTEREYIYDSNDISYQFNRRFELLHALKFKPITSININTIDKEKVIEEIKAFLDPVVDAQGEPIINLQWLFNLLYQDQFK